MDRDPIIWKVVLNTSGVETVYLVTAHTRREAELAVLEVEYDPSKHVLPAPATRGNATPFAYCKAIGCSIGATPWVADLPYKLYTLNINTGAMS